MMLRKWWSLLTLEQGRSPIGIKRWEPWNVGSEWYGHESNEDFGRSEESFGMWQESVFKIGATGHEEIRSEG